MPQKTSCAPGTNQTLGAHAGAREPGSRNAIAKENMGFCTILRRSKLWTVPGHALAQRCARRWTRTDHLLDAVRPCAGRALAT
eukprot:2895248-Lingulodinium_polyedra.AAC.1